MLGAVSQTRFSDENRTHDTHANSLAHYALYYQGALKIIHCNKENAMILRKIFFAEYIIDNYNPFVSLTT